MQNAEVHAVQLQASQSAIASICFGIDRGLPVGFFCSGVQFYLLLGPYLCFIFLSYLDLYVLGDDALISWESFMQTKYLRVLIHI